MPNSQKLVPANNSDLKVDTQEAVPNEESQSSFLYCPSKGWMSER